MSTAASVQLAEAVVSVEDRGYQFADGVYEVVGTYGGCPYALEPHLERLQGNLGVLHLPLDIREYGLRDKLMEGIERSDFGETLVYIQVTRGVAPRQHEFPPVPVAPTVVMTFKELRRLPQDLYDHGVEVISTADLRWKCCDIKSIALLPNILAKQAAAQVGAFEALLVDAEGRSPKGLRLVPSAYRRGNCTPRLLALISCRVSPGKFSSTWPASSISPSKKSFAHWPNLRSPMRSFSLVLLPRRCR